MVARFFLTQNTKTGENLTNGQKMYKMAIEYSKLFHSKALKNLPKSGFFVRKQGDPMSL
jgi:hypothetical protein